MSEVKCMQYLSRGDIFKFGERQSKFAEEDIRTNSHTLTNGMILNIRDRFSKSV